MVGACNKNGIFYAFRRGAISGDQSGVPVSRRRLLQGATRVQVEMKLLQLGMGRGSMWGVPSLEESFAWAAYGRLIQQRVPFSGSIVTRPYTASWLRRSSCLGLLSHPQGQHASC